MYTPVYNVVGGGISQVYVLRVHVRCSFISYDTSGQSAVGRTRNERGVAKSRPDSGRRFRAARRRRGPDLFNQTAVVVTPTASFAGLHPRRRCRRRPKQFRAAGGFRDRLRPRPQPPVAAAPAPTRCRTSPLPSVATPRAAGRVSFGPRLLLSTRPGSPYGRRRRVGSRSMRIIGRHVSGFPASAHNSCRRLARPDRLLAGARSFAAAR